jgi:hypothetical protein
VHTADVLLQDELDKLKTAERPKTEEEKAEDKKKEEEQQKELSDIEIKDGDYQVCAVNAFLLFFTFEAGYVSRA